MAKECSIRHNCLSRYDCSFCIDYSDYRPEDKKVLSPRQIQAREARRRERKELKLSEASKRGKRNKQAGYRSERSQVAKYTKWGFEAERNPGSGMFKGNLAGDIKVRIRGKMRRQEDKKRQEFNSYYAMTEKGPIIVENFCVMMNEDDYHAALLGNMPDGQLEMYLDEGFKKLHDFFEQDNSDIVSMRAHGKHKCVYAVTFDLWNDLFEEEKEDGVVSDTKR